ncbi:similar to Saccharomyces cerevisiae YDR475C JIP4 Protein of unknown function [Maudiozyma saulgeensis]|uniref:Uncharacterized protein n=1 Tax=Maudiozyma saulgeensis TaxID=1789683 RepID=A0A1X7R9X4_9SACH|nr:similar to Saccharomyces cerevisiae YDR475C JIP4 Protein of unknown function [Kazachstania saulgeensis]
MVMDVPAEDQLSQNEYKSVKFYSPLKVRPTDSNIIETQKKQYPYKSMKPCISFNTVPMINVNAKRIDKLYKQDFPGVQFPTDYTMEEYYDNESGYAGENNTQYNLHNQYLLNNLNSVSTHMSVRQPSPTRFPSSSASSSNLSNDKFSLGKRQQSHKSIQLTEMFKIAKNGKIVREDYPTRPTIQNNSLVLNNTTSKWDKLWTLHRLQLDNRTLHKENFFKYPDILFTEHKPNIKVLEDMDSDGFTPLTKNQKRKIKVINERIGYPNLPRTILCRIDGRKHTWVGLDWLFTNCIKDTDHVIVVTNLPSLITRRKPKLRSARSATRSGYNGYGQSTSVSRSRSRGRRRSALRDSDDCNSGIDTGDSDSDDDDDTNDSPSTVNSWYPGYDINQIRAKMRDIQIYIESLLLLNNPSRDIKLTIEITVGKTINCLCNTTNIYTPDLIVTSNLNVEAVVKWKSNYISDKLCSSFPIPVIVVPALYMNNFEKVVEMKSQQLMTIPGQEPSRIIPVPSKEKQTGQELLEVLDQMTYKSLKESIKLNKITSQAKKKQMVDVVNTSLSIPQKSKKKSSKKSKSKSSKVYPSSLSPVSSISDIESNNLQTNDLHRLKPVKSVSYNVAEHTDPHTIPIYRSKSSAERIPLKHYKSNSEVPRKHISSSSSSASSNKGFFSSLFKGSATTSGTKEKKKGIFW